MNKLTLSGRSAEFAELPAWVIPARPDVPAFFAALALAELEGGYFRLRSADQRRLLGCVPFGQCALKSDGATLTVFRTCCFGTDCDVNEYTGARLAEKIAAGEDCRPGIYGKLRAQLGISEDKGTA